MNTMRFPLVLSLLVSSSALLNACTPWDCEKGTGDPVKQTLTVASFHGIVVQGSMEIQLRKGDVQQVDVEAQPNLIGLLRTEVKNGIWHISTTKCYSTDKPFVVYITVPTMDLVSVQGSGDVNSTDAFKMTDLKLDVQGSGEVKMTVQAQRITATVQGSGDIDLKGTSGTLTASVQGSGDIDAGELKVGTAKVEVAGSGDIIAQPTDLLDATVSGSGDIKYRGRPAKLVQDINGSGELKQVE